MNTCHAQWSKLLPPTMSICLRAVITSFIFNKHKQTRVVKRIQLLNGLKATEHLFLYTAGCIVKFISICKGF